MYRNEYKASCSDLNKKLYCLGGTLRRGGGDCVLLCGGRRGDISMTYHCRYSSDTYNTEIYSSICTTTTPRSLGASMPQQHTSLCSTNVHVNSVLTLVTSGWGVGPEHVPRHHLQRLSWMDVYCGQWIGKWRDKPAIVISTKYSFTQTVCIYCSNHCDQSSLISPSR